MGGIHRVEFEDHTAKKVHISLSLLKASSLIDSLKFILSLMIMRSTQPRLGTKLRGTAGFTNSSLSAEHSVFTPALRGDRNGKIEKSSQSVPNQGFTKFYCRI